jgi:hypothetical protein
MARGLREEAACSEAHNLEVQRFSGKGKGCAIICAFYSSTTPSMILVFSTCLKNISSQFFDLGIENPLGRGTLAKIELTLYRTSVPETCRVVTCSITGVQSRYPPVEHSQMPLSQRYSYQAGQREPSWCSSSPTGTFSPCWRARPG